MALHVVTCFKDHNCQNYDHHSHRTEHKSKGLKLLMQFPAPHLLSVALLQEICALQLWQWQQLCPIAQWLCCQQQGSTGQHRLSVGALGNTDCRLEHWVTPIVGCGAIHPLQPRL